MSNMIFKCNIKWEGTNRTYSHSIIFLCHTNYSTHFDETADGEKYV